MFKKFYFWIVFILIASIGSVVFIHWKTLEGLHERTARVLPFYQRLKTLDSMSLNLEKYRRVSSTFRKLTPEEISNTKSSLKKQFDAGIAKLDQLDPTPEERLTQHGITQQLNTLFETIDQVEPTLFSKDAYVRPHVQALHEEIQNTLAALVKSTDSRITSLHLGNGTAAESQSVILLIGVGIFICLLMLAMILKSYFMYQRPLDKLHQYASSLKDGVSPSELPVGFSNLYGDIQKTLSHFANEVNTLVKNRHRFILDIVEDLQGPLAMLQAGKTLMSSRGEKLNGEQQFQIMESVRRGLAIFSGSLEDLNDIVWINQLQTRISEKTVDVSELLFEVCHTLFGSDWGKKITINVPPIPVWVSLDVRRFERVLFHLISKVSATLPRGSTVSVSVNSVNRGTFRGLEIVVYDSDRVKKGHAVAGGPEQDILKHWISENGLSMTLVQKIIKVHGGTLTAAGIAGTSVSVSIRLPHERIKSNGLIAPPSEEVEEVAAQPRSLTLSNLTLSNQIEDQEVRVVGDGSKSGK